MPGADGAGGMDGTDVFCLFKHYTHMLYKVKHWRNLLFPSAPLHRMDTSEAVENIKQTLP